MLTTDSEWSECAENIVMISVKKKIFSNAAEKTRGYSVKVSK